MTKKFYITTPLYYVNASPHIGHSYTNIAADCLARYMRQVLGNENVWFLTGTDEHGQKIERAAQEAGLSTGEFTDKMVFQFKELWQKLDISYNDFIRTTESRHIDTVQKALEILYKKQDIYQAEYEGWYCLPCETFWSESQAVNQLCPDCKRTVEKISENNFFFKLSRYQDWLIGYIDNHPDFIKPQNRRNEVLSFLNLNKLNDLCISRPKERLGWGISIPFAPDHVTYVWFDALLNYISAVGKFDEDGNYRSRWWPADLHLIGKDILRQHAIYWPIMLKALNIELPWTIFAHGWWMVGESKMSKSRGNVVSPIDMADRFGIDVYRYFLLRDVPFGLDGSFSEDAIIKRLNGDLANDLGNLLHRTATMVEKYFGGDISKINAGSIAYDSAAKNISEKEKLLPEEVLAHLNPGSDFNFSSALEKVWELIKMANKYIEDTKPWNLAKENKTAELAAFIYLLVELLGVVAQTIAPFMPATAVAIKERLGAKIISKGTPLFPRIENKP